MKDLLEEIVSSFDKFTKFVILSKSIHGNRKVLRKARSKQWY